MNEITAILKKDDGSVIVAAILILVILTIIGIAATSTSNMELNITSNAQLHKTAFFTAESGWHVMIDWLDDQFPLPTVNLGSDNWMAYDGTDNDSDGVNNEHDENIDFTNVQFVQGPTDGVDNDGDGAIDESDEVSEWIPFSTDKMDYQYRVTAQFIGAGIAAGWDPTQFLRYHYIISSTGNVPARKGDAVSEITVTAGKIEKVGS